MMYYIEIGYHKFIVEESKINEFAVDEDYTPDTGYTEIEYLKNKCKKFEKIELIDGIMEV